MSTSRRERDPAAIAMLTACLSAALVAESAEVSLVATGLVAPTAVVVRSEPGDDTQALVAESVGPGSDVGRVVVVTLDAPIGHPRRTLIEGLRAGPIALTLATDDTLLVAASGLAAHDLSVSPPRRIAATGDGGPPAWSALASRKGLVFALGRGAEGGPSLQRFRRIAARLTEPRRVAVGPGVIAGVAFGPRGYLVLLVEGAQGMNAETSDDVAATAWRLVFLDPSRPQVRGRAVAIDSLRGPTAIAYASSDVGEPFLYTLAEGGLYRLDAALDPSGRQSAVAIRIAAIEGATALAGVPDGSLCVTASRPDGSGELLRVEPF